LVTFSVLFPFMMLLPLRYTLFPYTTLFRSQGLQVDRVVVVGDHIGSGIELADPLVGTQPKPTVPIGQNAVYDLIGQAILHGKPLDRKSTRLNSSHVKISYAVFCLKKKK